MLVQGLLKRRALLLTLLVLLGIGGLPTPSRAAVEIGGHYTLETLDGNAVTEQSFVGRWQLVYFGFTLCADACPLALSQISAAMKDLGPLANRIQPIFITIDPERDSAESLKVYLSHFDRRIVGLRGTQAQTDAAADAFRVYFKQVKVKPESETYSIEHSSFLFLTKPDGSFARLLQGDEGAHRLADQLRQLVQ